MTLVEDIVVKQIGRVDYTASLEEMRSFTSRRNETTQDEIWLVEHSPVYTLGQAAKAPAVKNGIPVVQSDRGGEITYHGPGQAVVYTLVDLARRGVKVKEFVRLLEQSVIDLLDGKGERKPGAPGVYVGGAKIAALGIRVRQGRAYHGLALNVDMDLSPFLAIDPCGYPGLEVTQTKNMGMTQTPTDAGAQLAGYIIRNLEDA